MHTKSQLPVDQWIEILGNGEITSEFGLLILQTIYSCENHSAPASQAAAIMGRSGKTPWSPLNSEIWRYAVRIQKSDYPITFSIKEDTRKERFWDIFFSSDGEGKLFPWRLYSELIEALEKTGQTGEVQYPEEFPREEESSLTEGAKKTISVNVYERSTQARNTCVGHWGTSCSVCEMDFASEYGKIGKGYIHVHHLTPISSIKENYEINPVKDLRPVCPNCHAMLHRENPPLSIQELKERKEEQRREKKKDLRPAIREIVERFWYRLIDEGFEPLSIHIYGSQVTGDYHHRSDINVLLVLSERLDLMDDNFGRVLFLGSQTDLRLEVTIVSKKDIEMNEIDPVSRLREEGQLIKAA